MSDYQERLYRIPDREATAIPRRAAVDLGSNTFRLLIGTVVNGRVHPLVRELMPVRLGESLATTGAIGEAALARAREALAAMAHTLRRHDVATVRACGTAALRMATNRDRFLAEAATILGQAVEVIDGHEEARLSCAGALAAMSTLPAGPLWLADVGGGSSELIRLTPEVSKPLPRITAVHSLPLGAVSLSETFLRAPLTTAAELADLAARVDTALAPVLAGESPAAALVAIGGTATALAALDCGLTAYEPSRIQDYRLSSGRLDELLDRLAGLTAAERNRLPGLGQGRGEIVIGGLVVLRRLLARLAFEALTVSDGGLPEGILLAGAPPGGAEKTLR